MTTNTFGTPDEPTGGKVLDFPSTRDAETDPVAAAGDVVDVESEEDQAPPIPVDQPGPATVPDDQPLADRLAELTKARRAVLPSWLRSRAEFAEVIRWTAGHVGHVTAFHAVRTPIYLGKLIVRSPHGLVRVVAQTGAWVADAEGQALREHAVDRKDAETYLKLKSVQPRGRFTVVVLAAVVLAVAGLLLVGFRLLALALDVLVELRVFELKGTGDLSPLEPVCHHYAQGAKDETLEALMISLRELYTELERRADRIDELARRDRSLVPDNKVTPDVAGRRSFKLWPIAFAVDECQELFSHPDFKDEAERLCTAIIKRGPALGIMLILATQRPDSKSLPTGISDNVAIRFCLKVSGQVANDMVLGTSSYQEGIRATQFTPILDAGIGWLKGATPEPKIVRSFYLDGPGAEKIVVRARALREAAGTLTGHAVGQKLDAEQSATVSLLADVLSVIRTDEDKLWSETVVDRLAELRPEVYGEWAEQKPANKATQLAAALKPYGIETEQVYGRLANGKAANRRGVVRQHVADAHEARRAKQEGNGG